MGYELWDDPTWNCDYWRRCNNKVIKRFLQDIEDCKNMDEVQDVFNKWDQEYKKNEEDDK